MNNELINKLVRRASKLGAKGIEVIGWMPPQSVSDNPDGVLVTRQPETKTGSEMPWYDE